jgi:1-pyrroline-5-carboxylate dehydrogenase
MNNARLNYDMPANEPVLEYLPGSPEREALEGELARQRSEEIEIPLVIGGREIRTGNLGTVRAPHDHGHVLARYHRAGEAEIREAVRAALRAKEDWANLSWDERCAIMLKAAELISKKYRWLINGATMLGQGKNAFQAEIDAACEVIDYLRFGVHEASLLYDGQPPAFGPNCLNRLEYRPLEGFVLAVTPFNFTAIALNLNASVAMMGNTTIWKPATTALLSSYYLMRIYQEAGLPDGVINFVPGSGAEIGRVCLADPLLAGIHFTGSNVTFNQLWQGVAANLANYRSYPRLVGETGGKDFIFAHASADPEALATAIVRGAYEYQGQKCSASSRAYIPRSLWARVRDRIIADIRSIRMGGVEDFDNFVNAVIDEPAYDSIMEYVEYAKASPEAHVLAGGKGDKKKGWFIEPTLIQAENPRFRTMEEEIFGPVMTVYVYEDGKYEETLDLCDGTSPYALTGSIFARDRYALVQACRKLRYAAGNFYYNDKTTGAQVGQQPFGGSRASGTNDKAGTRLNLMRWVSPRTVKETLIPPTDYCYDYMSR